MSGVRTVVGLVAGIAAVAAVHLALDVRSDSAPRTLRRNALVPAAEKATALSVRRAGEPVTTLAQNELWNIVEPYAASADMRVVLRLTDALAYAPISDEMTDAELLRLGRTREDFGLDKPRLVVTVGDGDRQTVVLFGAATPAGDGVYATVGESDTVYVVSTNVYAAADFDAMGFRRRRVFEIGPESVTSFDVMSGAGRFVRLVRDGEAWKVSEPREVVASSSRVRDFLNALVTLEAQSFVWPVGVSNETGVASVSLLAGYGLDPESSVTVTLKCADGKDRLASFGRDAGQGGVYALVQGGSTIVTVPVAVRDLAAAGEAAFVDTRLFPLDVAAVNAIALDDGGSATLLSRSADGLWRLDAPVSAPADVETVDALVTRLLTLRHSDIAEDGVRVSVGTNAEPFSVSRKALFAGLRPDDLRSKEIAKFDPKFAKRVVTTDVDKKPVAVVFDADRSVWTVESAESAVAADGEAIAKLLEALHPLRAIRIARLKVSVGELGVYSLDKPFRTVAIDQTAEDSVRRNILVGDVTDGGRFATLGSSDAVFVISSDSAAALLAPVVK